MFGSNTGISGARLGLDVTGSCVDPTAKADGRRRTGEFSEGRFGSLFSSSRSVVMTNMKFPRSVPCGLPPLSGLSEEFV